MKIALPYLRQRLHEWRADVADPLGCQSVLRGALNLDIGLVLREEAA